MTASCCTWMVMVTDSAQEVPVACGVPDNTDCDDTETHYADTDGDGYGAGAPVACGVTNNTDDCPSVPGLIGSNCDAQAGPGFVLGQLNGSCTCVAIACTENVVVDLRSDANSEQIGWEILTRTATWCDLQRRCSG
ncbi:MAG: hypothetical protein H6592_09155 [Flavobacteriales bacterium]|nr:hypothetical protein [Flavobacteriales bacterium]